jgi:hypothetical protein
MSAFGLLRLASLSVLAVQVNANGSIRRIDYRDVIVNAFLGTSSRAARQTSTCAATARASVVLSG